jgi:2-haloacid dehalogenase
LGRIHEPEEMRALAFDVYGTLVDVDALEPALNGIVPRPREFLAEWRSKQLEYSFLLGLMGRYRTFSDVTSRALAFCCGKSGIVLEARQREALLRAWRELPAFPDAVPALTALTGRLVLATLTNMDPAGAREVLAHAGLTKFFEEQISVDEVRTFKPDPAVYHHAAKRLRLEPKDVGLVSSNPFDVMGAKAAGLTAIWVHRSKVPLDPLDLAPDIEVKDLTGLPHLL